MATATIAGLGVDSAKEVSQVRGPSNQTNLPRMKSLGDVFQLGSSGDVSKIEPALQDTVVAAIADLGIAAHTCPSRKPRQQRCLRAGNAVPETRPEIQSARPS